MSNPWFNSEQRVAALITAAKSWEGTPFKGNQCAKKVGVSCQMLAAAIYKEAGFLPNSFTADKGPMDWSNAHKDSLIESFLGKHADKFEAHPRKAGKIETVQAGDLVGFKLGGCVQHMGIVVNKQFFVHVMDRYQVQFSRLDDPTFASRMEVFWRPLDSVKLV